jgi:hypothetical protein
VVNFYEPPDSSFQVLSGHHAHARIRTVIE